MSQGQFLTYPLLGLSVFARQVCLPIPAVLFLISAGTLVRDGRLELPLVLLTAVLGAVAGDALWFEAGRHWGSHILRLLTSLSDDPKALSLRARSVFARFGLISLLFAKFIPGLDGITPPLAGMEGTRRVLFVLFDAGGSLLWAAAYIAIGLCFSRQVDKVLAFVQTSERLLLFVVVLPSLVYAGWRTFVILGMLRRLRTRHISPALLKAKRLDEPGRVVVIDLLGFQETVGQPVGIPGAVRVDPTRLRNKTIIDYPSGMSFVLYTSNSSAYRCARVALTLKRRGVEDVWILEGGIRNWIEAGLPTTDQLLTEDQAIAQYGLRIRTVDPNPLSAAPLLEVSSERGLS